MFRTQYAPHSRVFCRCGTDTAPVYELNYDEDGKKDLVETGRINTYERIQSWKESCDLKTILAKFANGDVSALNRNAPIYGDFTLAPSTLADYYNRINKAEAEFYKLPVDVRAKFDHSPSEYFCSMGTESFAARLGINLESNGSTEAVAKGGDVVNEPER